MRECARLLAPYVPPYKEENFLNFHYRDFILIGNPSTPFRFLFQQHGFIGENFLLYHKRDVFLVYIRERTHTHTHTYVWFGIGTVSLE